MAPHTARPFTGPRKGIPSVPSIIVGSPHKLGVPGPAAGRLKQPARRLSVATSAPAGLFRPRPPPGPLGALAPMEARPVLSAHRPRLSDVHRLCSIDTIPGAPSPGLHQQAVTIEPEEVHGKAGLAETLSARFDCVRTPTPPRGAGATMCWPPLTPTGAATADTDAPTPQQESPGHVDESEVLARQAQQLASLLRESAGDVLVYAAADLGPETDAVTPRARSHCRFAPPLIHFIPESLTYSVPLFLKRQCDRTLGDAGDCIVGRRRVLQARRDRGRGRGLPPAWCTPL
jgi:hypothetical protein